MKSYKEEQRKIQNKIFKDNVKVSYGNKEHPHILKNVKDNFFDEDLYKTALEYYNGNNISWWHGTQPTGNILSSQIACINHLMPLMSDESTVLSILQGIDANFSDVLTIDCDVVPRYIGFEVVSKEKHLNERTQKRGSNCTSLDAVMLGIRNNVRTLVSIEWKYVESYGNEDKSLGSSGQTRKNRYGKLINNSIYLKHYDDNEKDPTAYYTEPFYQLMRQTLWSEQMVKNAKDEDIKAKDYLHIHVVPKNNRQLRDKEYPCGDMKNMENTWRGLLSEDGKERYILMDPEVLLTPIYNLGNEKYSLLLDYLCARYWS